MRLLDRPVWSSLNTRQRELSVGGPLARRYQPGITVFAAARDDSEPALEALSVLITPGAKIFVLQAGEIVLPSGFAVERQGAGVQMLAPDPMTEDDADIDIQALSAAHAPEMVALAGLTEPGPFLAKTHLMGRFWGVFLKGRLAAMAGERMRLPSHTEVSGVCTHPDFQGQGLARRLSAHVARDIQARGETPFLHAWTSNARAVGLYERLGFVKRTDMHAAVLRRL